MYKLDCERPGRGRSSSSSLGEFNARAREVELEHEVKRLKQVSPGLQCRLPQLNSCSPAPISLLRDGQTSMSVSARSFLPIDQKPLQSLVQGWKMRLTYWGLLEADPLPRVPSHRLCPVPSMETNQVWGSRNRSSEGQTTPPLLGQPTAFLFLALSSPQAGPQFIGT